MFNIIQASTKISNSESGNPIFSNLLVQWLEDSYITSKIELSLDEITESSLILSMFNNAIKYSNTSYFRLLKNIDFEEVKSLIVGLNAEAINRLSSKRNENRALEKLQKLEKYTTNLTTLAKEGKIDLFMPR